MGKIRQYHIIYRGVHEMDRFFNRFFMKEDLTLNSFFKNMVDDISKITQMAQDIVKKTAESAMTTWELIEDMDLSNIYYLSHDERMKKVNELLKHFKEQMKKLNTPEEVIEKSYAIAQNNFKSMFQVRT